VPEKVNIYINLLVVKNSKNNQDILFLNNIFIWK